MSANPRDPAFEEAANRYGAATLACGELSGPDDPTAPAHHEGARQARINLFAAHDTAITRAVRDTREEGARVADAFNDGDQFTEVAGQIAARLRALNPTTEPPAALVDAIQRLRGCSCFRGPGINVFCKTHNPDGLPAFTTGPKDTPTRESDFALLEAALLTR